MAERDVYQDNVRILQRRDPRLPLTLPAGTEILFGDFHGRVLSHPARLERRMRLGEPEYVYHGKVNGRRAIVYAIWVDLRKAGAGGRGRPRKSWLKGR